MSPPVWQVAGGKARDDLACEEEVASLTSTALMTLQRWMERIAAKEVERIKAKCRRYQEAGKQVPRWVRAGMDERFRCVEQVEQRVQMLLGDIRVAWGLAPRV